jgi:hypothetical protein
VKKGEIEMGKVNLTVDDSVETNFRQTAFNTKGMKKGFLTDATQEAMILWTDLVKATQKGEDDEAIVKIVRKRLGIDG